MLQAINSNKAGRNISSNEIHWRKMFKASEDSLTSTIFSLLFYLPNELFWKILIESSYDQRFPIPSKTISKEFWPSWDPTGTSNLLRVEPDIFLRTPEFDLIIEAKRYDNNQQSKNQWHSELQAYLNEYAEDNKIVYLLALGGISSEITDVVSIDEKNYNVVMCRWNRIVQVVRKILTQLEQTVQLLNNVDAIINILNDLLLGFRIHGYATGEWFEDIDCKRFGYIRDQSFQNLLLNPFN